MRAFIFDLDDTLVDTSKSFDQVVYGLVGHHSGTPATSKELFGLRAEGGYNCDWDATVEILKRRGITRERSQIEAEGLKRYLEIGAEAEELMIELSMLQGWSEIAPLCVVTGRVRAEYDPIWGARLNPIFQEIVCKDDRAHLKPKPSSDQVIDLMQRRGITSGYFIGNAVDDMRAGVGAGLTAIGVTTNQSEETLRAAGAELVVSHPRELEAIFRS